MKQKKNVRKSSRAKARPAPRKPLVSVQREPAKGTEVVKYEYGEPPMRAMHIDLFHYAAGLSPIGKLSFMPDSEGLCVTVTFDSKAQGLSNSSVFLGSSDLDAIARGLSEFVNRRAVATKATELAEVVAAVDPPEPVV